jgi:hypothetical protein
MMILPCHPDAGGIFEPHDERPMPKVKLVASSSKIQPKDSSFLGTTREMLFYSNPVDERSPSFLRINSANVVP